MQALFTHDAQPELGRDDLLRHVEESYRVSQRCFLLMLDQCVSAIDYAVTKKTLAQTSLTHEDEDVPEVRLAENPLLKPFHEDDAWKQRLRQDHIFDYHDRDLTRHLFKMLGANPVVREYLSRPVNTPEEDRDVFLSVLTGMVDDDVFQSWIEEIAPTWWDDAEVCVSAATHVITHLPKAALSKQLRQLDEKSADTLQFARDLLVKTLEHSEEAVRMIGPAATNWEVERIATVDMILMRMAFAEVLEFPTIPVKVTINEYIDISKSYSTPKSKEFINGVLDKVMHQLRKEGRVVKSGRGLIET